MKSRLVKFLVILLTIYSITIPVNATTYSPYDASITYEEYLTSNDTSTRYLAGDTIFGLLGRKYNIDLDMLSECTLKTSYYTNNWHLTTIDRMTMLIDIMRLNMLIPDPDSTDIIEYPWEDIPDNISAQDLAYINYAKQLGITSGTGEYTFGFNENATYEHFDAFANNISKIENIEQYQVECPIKVIDNTNKDLDRFAEPLIIEYFNTLPDRLVADLCIYTIYIDDQELPEYSYATGLTYTPTKIIRILGTSDMLYGKNFNETMIHEFGHAVNDVSGINLIHNVNNYNEILDIEMPKMGRVYRSYATTNKYEFFACAWYYNYLRGEEIFASIFPETSILFNTILDGYK